MEEQVVGFKLLIQSFFALFILPFWYCQKLIRRNSSIWVFGAWFGQQYSDNSKMLFEYVLDNEPSISPYWLTRNKSVYAKLQKEGKPVVMTTSMKGMFISLRAKVVFLSNSTFDVNEKCINGSMHVWLWHGAPMKYIMEDEFRFIRQLIPYSLVKRFKLLVRSTLFPYYTSEQYDFVLNISDFFAPFFKSAFKIDDSKLLTLGFPRNDVFYQNQKEPFITNLDEAYNQPIKLLYMPTFRDSLMKKGDVFNPFSQFGFSAIELKKMLEEQNIVFLYKGHFVEKNLSVSDLGPRFMCINSDSYEDMYRFIKDVDILMTDYSSIYFDFLLLNKPIILAPFDYESYVRTARPLYFDYKTEIKGNIATDWPQILSLLKSKSYTALSADLVTKFHSFPDGNSSQRLVEYIKQQFQK